MARCQRSHWHLSTWLVIFYGKVNKAQEPPSVAEPGYPTRVKGCCEVRRRPLKHDGEQSFCVNIYLIYKQLSFCLMNFSVNKHNYRLHSNETTENWELLEDKWEYDYINVFVTMAKFWFYFQCGILLRCSLLLHLFISMFFTALFTWFRMTRVELYVTAPQSVFVCLMLWKGWRNVPVCFWVVIHNIVGWLVSLAN